MTARQLRSCLAPSDEVSQRARGRASSEGERARARAGRAASRRAARCEGGREASARPTAASMHSPTLCYRDSVIASPTGERGRALHAKAMSFLFDRQN